jgi:serine/threonine-protein kinase
MLLFAGGVKLLDFGIAKAATAATAAGEADGVKGKFGYLAPEQARNGEVDGRADIFALGVTLWEMLAGKRLFAGKDEVETLRNVLQKPVPPPSAMRPDIPPELDRIVLKALERSPEKRYATADEMARDCDAVLGMVRADSQTLRTFLNDLFSEEMSSLSQNIPELPEELFADGTPNVVARDTKSQSLEIEVIDPSGPHGRTRTPAPPFGVMATDDADLKPATSGGRLRLIGAVVVAAAVLVTLGLARQRHAPAASPLVAAPAPASAPAAAPAAPEPAPAPSAAPAAPPAPAAAAAAAPSEKADDHAEAAPKSEHRGTGHRRRRELSNDMTLNPF